MRDDFRHVFQLMLAVVVDGFYHEVYRSLSDILVLSRLFEKRVDYAHGARDVLLLSAYAERIADRVYLYVENAVQIRDVFVELSEQLHDRLYFGNVDPCCNYNHASLQPISCSTS